MDMGAFIKNKFARFLVLLAEISFLFFLGSLHAARAQSGLTSQQKMDIEKKMVRQIARSKFDELQNEYTERVNPDGSKERVHCGQSCLFRAARKMTTEYSLQKSIQTCQALRAEYKNLTGGEVFGESSIDVTNEKTFENYNPSDKSKIIGNCITSIDTMAFAVFEPLPTGTDVKPEVISFLSKLRDRSNPYDPIGKTSKFDLLLSTAVTLQENAGNLVHYNTAINDLKGLKKECLNVGKEKCQIRDDTELKVDDSLVPDATDRIQRLENEKKTIQAKIDALKDLDSSRDPSALQNNPEAGDTLIGMAAEVKMVMGSEGGHLQVIDRADDAQFVKLDRDEEAHLLNQYNKKIIELQKTIDLELQELNVNRNIASKNPLETEKTFSDMLAEYYNSFAGFISGWWGAEKDKRMTANSYSNLDLIIHPDLVRDVGTGYYKGRGTDSLSGQGTDPIAEEEEPQG